MLRTIDNMAQQVKPFQQIASFHQVLLSKFDRYDLIKKIMLKKTTLLGSNTGLWNKNLPIVMHNILISWLLSNVSLLQVFVLTLVQNRIYFFSYVLVLQGIHFKRAKSQEIQIIYSV